jgi:hypothetical protein
LGKKVEAIASFLPLMYRGAGPLSRKRNPIHGEKLVRRIPMGGKTTEMPGSAEWKIACNCRDA